MGCHQIIVQDIDQSTLKNDTFLWKMVIKDIFIVQDRHMVRNKFENNSEELNFYVLAEQWDV